jgi:hypothetical protein
VLAQGQETANLRPGSQTSSERSAFPYVLTALTVSSELLPPLMFFSDYMEAVVD